MTIDNSPLPPSAYQEVLPPCRSGWLEVSPADKGKQLAPAWFAFHVLLGDPSLPAFIVKTSDGRTLATISLAEPSDHAWACDDPVPPGKPCRTGDTCA